LAAVARPLPVEAARAAEAAAGPARLDGRAALPEGHLPHHLRTASRLPGRRMSVARTETVRGGGHGSAARAVAAGAPAGIVGGLAFGAAMARLGVLPTVATLGGLGSSRAGFAVHMAISAVVGAGFGLMVRRMRCGPSETVFLGTAYGTLWWCIGPLTLLPLALGQAPAWGVAGAQRAFPSLVGHLLFGIGTALAFVLLHGPGDPGRARNPAGAGTVLRGLAPGAALGLPQALLSPRSDQGVGAAVVRGQGYGFVAWVVGELTVLPLLADPGLRWALPGPGASSPGLPRWLLLGALAAATRTVLDRVAPLLSSEHLRAYSGAAAGSGMLAAALRGAVAGLLGGAVISQLMLRGAVPEVAERLTGSNGPLAGIAVNLAIGVAIGVSYGLLFRRLGQDVTCALGWGLSYGFLWWVLGPLTLLPALLGGDPEWSAAAAGRALSPLARRPRLRGPHPRRGPGRPAPPRGAPGRHPGPGGGAAGHAADGAGRHPRRLSGLRGARRRDRRPGPGPSPGRPRGRCPPRPDPGPPRPARLRVSSARSRVTPSSSRASVAGGGSSNSASSTCLVSIQPWSSRLATSPAR